MIEDETIRTFVAQLDLIIETFERAYSVGQDTVKEREAKELLKNARWKLIEDIGDDLD